MINDFIEYWVATKLLLGGGNSYSPAELLAGQQALGRNQTDPLLMWNPPWTLSFTLPFGSLDYHTAQFTWFLLHSLIIFLGARLLWSDYGGSPETSRYATLSVLAFAPIYLVLMLGQIGPLVLLGLIGFIAGIKRKKGFLAGASLTLVSIKPHLTYLVWLALLLWAVKRQPWTMVAGFAIAAMLAVSIPLFFNPQIYSHYKDLLQTGEVVRPLDWATPSLGTALAELLAISDAWIRWLPSLIGVVWFLRYWARHAETWDWLSELPLLSVVSAASASFVWTFDHVVFLPAVIQGAVWTCQSRLRSARALIGGLHAALGVALLAFKIFLPNDFWYFWVAPAYLSLFLYARATAGAEMSIRDTKEARA
jgi:hypothetical protein